MIAPDKRSYVIAAAGTVLGIVSAGCGIAANWLTGFADPNYSQLIASAIVGLVFAIAFATKGTLARLIFLLPCLAATILLVLLIVAWVKNGFYLGVTASDISPLKQRQILYLTSADTLLAVLSFILFVVAGAISIRSPRQR